MWFQLRVDCICTKEDDDEDEEDGEMGGFSTTVKIWIPYAKAFYTLIIVLGASKKVLVAFCKPREALKMVFGVPSIRVFSQAFVGSYYEPLPWFMILMVYMFGHAMANFPN